MVSKPVEIRTRKETIRIQYNNDTYTWYISRRDTYASKDNPDTIQQRYIHMVPKPVEIRTRKETIRIQYNNDTYKWYLSQQRYVRVKRKSRYNTTTIHTHGT